MAEAVAAPVGAAGFGSQGTKQRWLSPPPLSFSAKVSWRRSSLSPSSLGPSSPPQPPPSPPTATASMTSFDPHRLPISSPTPPPPPPPPAAVGASNGRSNPVESPPQEEETTDTEGDSGDKGNALKKDQESDGDARAMNAEDGDDDVDVEDGVDVNPEEEDDGEKKMRRKKDIPYVFDPAVQYS